LEDALNKFGIEHKVPSDESNKDLISFDDDKLWYRYLPRWLIEIGMESGLKQKCHTKDNVTGFTIHEGCYTVSGISIIFKLSTKACA